MHRRSLMTLVLITTLLVSFWPSAAHANILTDSYLDIAFNIVEGVIEMVRQLLGRFLAVLGTLLNLVISQPELNYGGAAVYTIWKIFRDICNMLFIVMFILVAFGTIFNAIKSNPFYYRNALMGVIIAAIAINFSLAIGQTIVWAGNATSAMVTNLISGKDISAKIAVSTQLSQIVMGQQPGLPIAVVASEAFTGNAKTAFDNCQKNNQQPTVDGCVAVAARIQAVQYAAAADFEISRLNESPSLKQRLQDAWSFWSSAAKGAVTGAAGGLSSAAPGSTVIGAARGAWNGVSLVPQPKEPGKLSTSEHVQKILSLILNVFLVLVLALSYCTVIFFLVLRIPMIWVLLAFSSLAFFSIAWPGSDQFRKWFGNLVGWCLFSPLYLFVIYIGLFLLEQQNSLLAGMKNAAFISGSFGILMFYGMTAFIFMGGAKYAMDISFKLSKDAGTLFGRIGGFTGVSEKTAFGLKTVGAYPVVAYTGAAAGVQSKYESTISKPLADRRENVAARWQARFGDKRAQDTLVQKRITDQFNKNKEAGFSVTDLKKDLSDVGTPKYFAAAKALLEANELDTGQMSTYVTEAAKVSPAYGRAVSEAVGKKNIDRAKEKKFKNEGEALDAFRLIGDEKSQDRFLRDLKKNQILEYAQLASKPETEALVMKVEGSTAKITAEDILKKNLSKVDAENFGKIKEATKAGGWNIDKELDDRLENLLGNQDNLYKLMDGTKDDAVRAQIKTLADKLKAERKRRGGNSGGTP